MRTGLTELDLNVVGLKYRVSASTRRMMAATVDDILVECRLEREPENVHDVNAVKVILETEPYKGFHIGYIDRVVAATLAPVLDAGVKVASAVVSEIDTDEGTGRINVVLKTPVRAKKKKPKRNP